MPHASVWWPASPGPSTAVMDLMNAPTRLIPLLVLAFASRIVAESTDNYINAPRSVVATVRDVTQVDKVRFFESADQGKTWQLLKEIPVPDGSTKAPSYEFRPQSDGRYLVATAAVYKSGAPEPDPTPGVIPSNAMSLIVDTFKPEVAQFEATLDHSTPDQATVAVQWVVTDANLGADPVVIEASSDGGISWPVSITAPAQGAQKLIVPLEPKAPAVMVRISAKDLASNATTSDPKTVALPPPPDPGVELAKAVSSLPAVNEIPTASASPAAGTSAATANGPALPTPTTPVATAASGTGDATATAASAAVASTATPAHPDIVAPHAADAALANPADGGLISGTSFEKSYLEQQGAASAPAPTPAATPAAGSDARPAPAPAPAPTTVATSGPDDTDAAAPAHELMPTSPTGTETGKPHEQFTGSISNLSDANTPAEPASTNAVDQVSSTTFLTNPTAATVLEEARADAVSGDTTDALRLYHRLEDSGQAEAAIHEELQLMIKLALVDQIVATVEELPPEFVNDEAHLDLGLALVSAKQYEQAIGALARVHAGAPEASQAMWLIATAFDGLGRPAQARRVLQTLASGSDEWAEKAQAKLGH